MHRASGAVLIRLENAVFSFLGSRSVFKTQSDLKNDTFELSAHENG